MSYCRYCGTEISYTRTANNKWLPYDVTGQPHFCQENEKSKPTTKKTGLKVCEKCGKPIFMIKRKKIDYTTLNEHKCKNGDITRYQKYLEKEKKLKK
ncbi:MAG: hypothetical protein J5527_09815 [Treponema sp.]|nr:hypothetical protein [Treponema sp.]